MLLTRVWLLPGPLSRQNLDLHLFLSLYIVSHELTPTVAVWNYKLNTTRCILAVPFSYWYLPPFSEKHSSIILNILTCLFHPLHVANLLTPSGCPCLSALMLLLNRPPLLLCTSLPRDFFTSLVKREESHPCFLTASAQEWHYNRSCSHSFHENLAPASPEVVWGRLADAPRQAPCAMEGENDLCGELAGSAKLGLVSVLL